MNKDYFLIINPSSDSGRAKKKIPRIISIFQQKSLNFTYKVTEKPKEAITLASEAIRDGWKIIVAVGGDGTICEVISGFFPGRSQNIDAKLGVLHIGTSPDFNRYHKIPIDLDQAIDMLERGKSKLIDVGKVSYFDFDGRKQISHFGSNVNIGLGPLIANKANSRHRTYLGDFLGTLVAVLQSLVTFKPFDLEINADGYHVILKNLLNLTIGKDPYLASGMKVFLPIAADDGRLYVLSIGKRSFLSILANLPKLYSGNFLEYEAAKAVYASRVEINSPARKSLLEFDGDTKGFLPAIVEVVPRALKVIVP